MSTPPALMLAIMAFMFVVSDGGLLNGTSTTSTLTSSGFTTTSTTSSTTVLEAVAEGATTKASGFNFLSWLGEWQTIVGLSMLVLTPCGTIAIGVSHDWILGSAAVQKTSELYDEKTIESVVTMWESASLYLIMYSSLKHSPSFAAIFGLCFTCLRSAIVFFFELGNKVQEMKKKVALYLMLLLSVYDQEPLEFSEQEVLFFVVGGFIGGVIRIHQGAFHSVEWRPFWREYFVHVEKDNEHYPYRRMILSWLVNELFAQAIVLLLPAILTASSDRVEFVKDATAVLFIAELDKIENIINEQMIATKGNTNDLVTTSPAGVAVAADGSYVILSDEHSQRILHLDRSVVPRRVRVIQGTEAIGDPKDVLLAENGTLFVSDEASHSIFAMEYICDADAVHYTGGCRALNLRRVLGAGSPGDGDVNRREPSTVTSTTVTTFTSTFTSTWSELPCWNHLLSRAGETCHSACARYQGTCDPQVRNNFDFDAFQHSVFWEERVSCQRDARTWWDNAMPSYETNPSSRNYGWCLGTWGMPQEIPCDALFMEYGQPSTTMRRWCKCRRDEMCYLTTTTTVLGCSGLLMSVPHVEVASGVTGESIAVFEQEEFADASVKALKQRLAQQIGIPRFRLRLLQDNSLLDDDQTLALGVVQLVRMELLPPDMEQDHEFMVACEENDDKLLEKHLNKPRNPNFEDANGITPLCAASLNGSLKCVSLLIEAGANKDQGLANDGATPLFVAAAEGHR
eukprot:symbB.v1.2.011447.t1/scaffold762.1/size178242/8